MKTVREKITLQELKKIAQETFGDLVKAVVDVEKKIMVVGGELHSDEEALLLNEGSGQQSLWGINLYPDLEEKDWIEFDSVINIRPSQGNFSRAVNNPEIKQKIAEAINKLVQR